MRIKTIVDLVGLAVFSAFALFACGKSSLPAEKGAHDHAGHDRAGCNHAKHDHAGHGHAAEPAKAEAEAEPVKNGFDGMPAPGTQAFCPVMKQDFKVTANSPFSVHEEKTYVFCCPSCKDQFEKNPKKYLTD